MLLALGTRLGPYEIQEFLGAGGMGEVYRARDTRLDRTVALKILPNSLAAHPDALHRFEREAKTLSNILDARICTLYDIGKQGELHYLVMEYIEGETLAERLEKGRLPMSLVLQYGIEICEALEIAHRKRIVHRDLKPGNIMLTKGGVKLLDFGLAKWSELAKADDNESEVSTYVGNLTEQGTIVGTVPYMSPEQLEGKATDHRTDIFAAGAVFYEMATGQRAFRGESKASLISAVLSSQPPAISKLRSDVLPLFDYVVDRCLAKEPDKRWQNAQDVATALKGIAENVPVAATTSVHGTQKHRYIAMFLAASVLLLLFAFVVNHFGKERQKETPHLLKLSVLPPEKSFVTSLALSPDGMNLVFTGLNRTGHSSLWVRSLDTEIPKQLQGTEDASYPFWSADGKSIGFFASGKLKTIPASGGSVQNLCDAPEGRGGTWNRDGTILFSLPREGILRIHASGGDPVVEVAYDRSRGVGALRWPHFLPDGRRYIYSVGSILEKTPESGISLGTLGSRESKQLLPQIINRVEYATPGYIVFVRQNALMAQAFDAEKGELRGEVVRLIEMTDSEGSTGYSPFSVSNNGVLAVSSLNLESQLTWFDRSGRILGALGEPGGFAAPNFSIDESKLVVARTEHSSRFYDLWTLDLEKGSSSRFTFKAESHEIPAVFSSDNSQIFFSSSTSGSVDIFQKPSSGMGEEKIVAQSKEIKIVTDRSRDGKYLLFEKVDPRRRSDLWVLSLKGTPHSEPYLETEFTKKHGQFSPDGKWVAYMSDETGKKEIYVQSFPRADGGRWQISTNGGDQPRWRNDGKEIYYIAPDRKLIAVAIQSADTFEAGSPVPLFETKFPPVPFAGGFIQYAVADNGQRFLVNTLTDAPPSAMTLILNWTRLLK